jgi:hypothetical protein
MNMELPKLIATSVVRGSQQGESHGGIYTVNFNTRDGAQHVDWNDSGIDFQGRGADRGLRGIAFDGDDIYVAASDELYCYNRDFEIQESFGNPYLKHCHEICRKGRQLFLTSTGFDSLLVFDLDTRRYNWGFHLQNTYGEWSGHRFDPQSDSGPAAVNDFHVNMVDVSDGGIFLSGLRTNALLHIDSQWAVHVVCNLPAGAHNAQLWNDGVIMNDTASDCVRYIRRDGRQQAFPIERYDDSEIEFAGIDDSKVARQGFGRGLTTFGGRFIIGGSSPSTITVYDTHSGQRVGSVNLSMDIRNAIHGLEIWPYD